MSDIVKKDHGQAVAGDSLRATRDWLRSDPFRMMRDWLSSDPFREMAPLFRSISGTDPALRPGFNPLFDVTETKEAYIFKVDVPGVKKEDIEITSTGNRIQISGKRDSEHESKTDTVYMYERQYGDFCRSFTLPDGADLDSAKSDLQHGVLTLAIPKKPGAQAKKIAISSSAKS